MNTAQLLVLRNQAMTSRLGGGHADLAIRAPSAARLIQRTDSDELATHCAAVAGAVSEGAFHGRHSTKIQGRANPFSFTEVIFQNTPNTEALSLANEPQKLRPKLPSCTVVLDFPERPLLAISGSECHVRHTASLPPISRHSCTSVTSIQRSRCANIKASSDQWFDMNRKRRFWACLISGMTTST